MQKFYAALAALIFSLLLVSCAASGTPAPAKSAPEAAAQVVPEMLKCANSSLIFPLPGDASECASVAGGAAFKTQLKPEEVIKFYRDFFGSEGWTLLSTAEATSVTPIAGWLKGNTTVQLIAFPQQGGGSSVNVNVAATQ